MYYGIENRGKIEKAVIGFSPKQTQSYFLGPKHCAKFHKNRIKIAAVGATTDTLTD